MNREAMFKIWLILGLSLLQFASVAQTQRIDALTLGVAGLIRQEDQRARESCMADGLMAGYCPLERDVEAILKSLKDGSIAK